MYTTADPQNALKASTPHWRHARRTNQSKIFKVYSSARVMALVLLFENAR
ncbi:MAG: hypothetical protein ACK4SY_07735 [Pyrobaculum sp.]